MLGLPIQALWYTRSSTTNYKDHSVPKVLLVDSSSRPIQLISWQRAVCMLYQGNAQILESEDSFWSSPNLEIPRALIIQSEDYVKLRPLRDNYIIKRVLLARDNFQCSYCSKPLTLQSMTVDHVKPKLAFIREGRKASDANTWINVVSACGPCNHKKGHKLPAECRMYPKTTPKKPNWVTTLWRGKYFHPIQAEYVAAYYKIDPNTLTGHEIKGKG